MCTPVGPTSPVPQQSYAVPELIPPTLSDLNWRLDTFSPVFLTHISNTSRTCWTNSLVGTITTHPNAVYNRFDNLYAQRLA